MTIHISKEQARRALEKLETEQVEIAPVARSSSKYSLNENESPPDPPPEPAIETTAPHIEGNHEHVRQPIIEVTGARLTVRYLDGNIVWQYRGDDESHTLPDGWFHYNSRATPITAGAIELPETPDEQPPPETDQAGTT